MYLIHLFLETYGHDYYWSTRWPTRDGVIPYQLFYLGVRAMQHSDARAQLRTVLGTAHAIGLSLGGKKAEARIKQQTRALIRRAYPGEM